MNTPNYSTLRTQHECTQYHIFKQITSYTTYTHHMLNQILYNGNDSFFSQLYYRLQAFNAKTWNKIYATFTSSYSSDGEYTRCGRYFKERILRAHCKLRKSEILQQLHAKTFIIAPFNGSCHRIDTRINRITNTPRHICITRPRYQTYHMRVHYSLSCYKLILLASTTIIEYDTTTRSM
jgi:hypothetical protein